MMGDPKIVAELRAAAQASLDRGFSILICEPHDKNPFVKYSPHAVNSATNDATIALKAWDDGHEANYGVAGGKSNLALVDCDQGLADEVALDAWMKKNNLPETFTVRSGRTTSAGFHLYYSGTVPTTGYNIDGVIGEIRGVGAYVVGPGSIHPSGKKYEIIRDVPVVSLPENLKEIAQKKHETMAAYQPGIDEKIPEGNRWMHLQSMAGKLRNLGLDRDGIYTALKNFCVNNCVNGDNYPNEKIELLADAADEKFKANVAGIVSIGKQDTEADTTIPETPISTIDGDALGDLSLALTNGTFIPAGFARASLKALAGAMLDDNIGFPGEPSLHMRHWNALISSRPEMGKGEAWKRIMSFMAPLAEQCEIIFPKGGFFSSGEHAIKTLAANDGKAHLAYFDEMRNLFEKGNSSGSTLFAKLLELYEQKQGGVGSLTHNAAMFENVSLSMTGGFTLDGFERATSGKGVGGDGFLSRMVLEYSGGVNYHGDWDDLDAQKVNAAVAAIKDAVVWLRNYKGEHKGERFVPVEDFDAKALRMDFQKWLKQQKEIIEKNTPGASYAARLESHFKRDLLIRVAFTPEKKITGKLTQKAIDWAKHQLKLRCELWTVDRGGDVQQAELKIVKAVREKGPLTKTELQKFTNAAKGAGGFDAWNRALTSVTRAGQIVLMPYKSQRGKEVFGFDGMFWSKNKGTWLPEIDL
jgi:hypothetical protein